jgi:2-amino-4-hydroxy-6-hydroxymethyldihydropteridine diphosphokinase
LVKIPRCICLYTNDDVKEDGEAVILLGLGANLPSAEYGVPQSTLTMALDALAGEGVSLERHSPWYRSAPVPPGAQPWFINGVAAVVTRRSPADLLDLLHVIERRFGRVRRDRNEPRVIDLDLLDYGGLVLQGEGKLVLPHPRLHERAFVLLPLRDIAPNWHHPVSGVAIDELIAALPSEQKIERIE